MSATLSLPLTSIDTVTTQRIAGRTTAGTGALEALTPAQARTVMELGTAALSAAVDFASAAQGTLADSAVQPGDLGTVATTNDYLDLDNLPTLGTAAAAATEDFAAAGHSHAWGTVTGTLADQTDLQSALDAKAASSHTHAPGDITQGGATTGQVLTWTGSAWAAGNKTQSAGATDAIQQSDGSGGFSAATVGITSGVISALSGTLQVGTFGAAMILRGSINFRPDSSTTVLSLTSAYIGPAVGQLVNFGRSTAPWQAGFVDNLFIRSGAGAPTGANIISGYATLWKNTSDGSIKWYANDGGTIRALPYL